MLCSEASIYLGWRYACRKCTDSYNHEMGEAKTKPKLGSSRRTSGHEATGISQLAGNGRWWAIKDTEFLPHYTRGFLQWPHVCFGRPGWSPPTIQPEASPCHPAGIRPANGLSSQSAALYNGQMPDNVHGKWTMVGDKGL